MAESPRPLAAAPMRYGPYGFFASAPAMVSPRPLHASQSSSATRMRPSSERMGSEAGSRRAARPSSRTASSSHDFAR